MSGLLLPLEQKWPLGTNCLLWSSGVCPPLVHPAGAKRSGSVTAVSVRMLEPALSSTGRCGPGASDGPLQVQPHNVFRREAQGSKTVMLTSSMSPSSMACNTFGLKVDCHSGMMAPALAPRACHNCTLSFARVLAGNLEETRQMMSRGP